MTDETPVFLPLDRERDVEVRQRNLPHWFQPGAAIFVTFRTIELAAQRSARANAARARRMALHSQVANGPCDLCNNGMACGPHSVVEQNGHEYPYRVSLSRESPGPLVRALKSFRGIDILSATVIAAELGDLTRFKTARQLMAFLGLVPSESSSGNSVKRGPLTKTGNAHVRRILIEAVQHYRHRPVLSAALRKRQEGISKGGRSR